MRLFRLLPESEQNKYNETVLLLTFHSPIRNLQIFVKYASHSVLIVNIYIYKTALGNTISQYLHFQSFDYAENEFAK
jgi:hypothetical protein